MSKILALCLPLALGAMSTLPVANAAPPAPETAKAPAIDPKARALLDKSVEKMRSLQTFSIHAEATRDDVVRDGFKVQRALTEDVLVKKPDRMRAEIARDDGKRLFIYDGKTLSVLVNPESYYATVAASPTLSGTLEAIDARYQLDLPLLDLLIMATGGDVGAHATEAGVIGTSRVGGAECDQVAFRSKLVDWQVWIDRSSQLPRKIVVTTRDVPTAPQYEAVLTWNTAPKINDADFSFTPPEGARQITVQPRSKP